MFHAPRERRGPGVLHHALHILQHLDRAIRVELSQNALDAGRERARKVEVGREREKRSHRRPERGRMEDAVGAIRIVSR